MKPLSISVILGLLVVAWAQTSVRRPLCDSAEAEEAALVARDYLNAQHKHGYKYELNRIEDIKVYTVPNGEDTYVLELDLLETNCHVLDPTPLANCTVRPKHFTAVEGDCDVVVKKAGGVQSVTAFKCKTEESTEDFCMGCFRLLPLNDTTATDFVQASLASVNKNLNGTSFVLLEVGRVSSQIVSGGPHYLAEYVVVEANCTDAVCVPLNDHMAERGICTAKGFSSDHTVDCRMFPILVPLIDTNSTVPVLLPPLVHVHGGSLSHKLGLKHHKLTTIHDPLMSGYLSKETEESSEVVPVAPAVVDAAAPAAPAPAADPALALDSSDSMEHPFFARFKRDVPAAPAVVDIPVVQVGLVPLVPVCPGKVRYFK